jgi:hypothetical protein
MSAPTVKKTEQDDRWKILFDPETFPEIVAHILTLSNLSTLAHLSCEHRVVRTRAPTFEEGPRGGSFDPIHWTPCSLEGRLVLRAYFNDDRY